MKRLALWIFLIGVPLVALFFLPPLPDHTNLARRAREKGCV